MVSLEDISCNICTKEFETNFELKTHMIRQHKEDPVSCEECGKEFLNKYALRSHMQSHEFDQCKVCHKRMKAKSLANHMEIHENSKSYTCEDCNVSYTRKESLTRHIKGHTEAQTPKVMIAKKTQIYHCDKCDYNTQTKRYMKSHTQVHEEKKSYKCNICQNPFNTVSSIR